MMSLSEEVPLEAPDRLLTDQLIDRLLSEKFIEDTDVSRIKRSLSQGGRLCATLVSMGLIPERQLVSVLSSITGLSTISSEQFPEQPVLENALSVAFLKKERVLPVSIDDANLVVAVSDPFDEFIEIAFEHLTGKNVRKLLATPSEIEDCVQRLYNAGRSNIDEAVDEIRRDNVDDELDAERLSSMASEAPVVRLVSLLIARAVEADASDIHFEAYENRLVVRYRIDGVLHDLETPPQHAAPAITSRIKIMAKLNIAERRLPQDGRIRLPVRGKTIDFRVSIIPTLHGERIVMRVLDKESTPKSLKNLGLRDDTVESVQQILSKPNGMFLVTGPTGSGKTTTLYSALLSLPAKQKNIITVEDPIEYQISNVNQIQIKPQIGLTFAEILRSILRQDPDIIFVGEIRDQETADIAVHAALTGHLVLSTLHTNTAAGTVTRLLDMDVQDYLLATSLLGAMSQRLVRRLCEVCKEPFEIERAAVQAEVEGTFFEKSKATIFKPRGCIKCHHTGYAGRTVIAEILILNDVIRQLVMRRAPAQEIHAAAISSGMKTMLQDGLQKVLSGVTSLEEVRQAVSGVS